MDLPIDRLLKSEQVSNIRHCFSSARSIILTGKYLPLGEREVVFKLRPFVSEKEHQCLTLCEEQSHPNIVKLFVTFDCGDGSVCQVFEKVPGEALIDLLSREKRMKENEVKIIARQLVSALSFLHGHGWCHRDIKPDNIIFDRRCCLMKLIDFEFCGRARTFNAHRSLSKGTFEYASPEFRRGYYEGPEVDVWSLGVTIFVSLTGYFPFTREELLSQQESFSRSALTTSISEPGCKFLEKTFVRGRKVRPRIHELAHDPWLRSQISYPCENKNKADN
eukprot:TRINITY_DN603_c0_g5_i1.p1 TRINITY_DN603_c0_g5~~TRINITY_DN603_c0_g5_i1.p1  ORF type:complete len:297 (-),score=58.33 TRINITY_DN603_c0_g5_i1:214-1044(-)